MRISVSARPTRAISSIWATLALVLAAGSSTGCGPGEEPVTRCRVDGMTTDAASADVQLGVREGSAFVPWTDGAQVAVTTGGQGAVMVIPRVRIPNAPADAEPRCMRIRIDNEFDYGAGPFPTISFDETFRVIDGGWESVSLEVPLDWGDVDMRMITFTSDARDDTLAAAGEVTVELLVGE